MSLWTKDFSKDDANLRIGQILKAKLNIPDSDPMRYEAHMVCGSPYLHHFLLKFT